MYNVLCLIPGVSVEYLDHRKTILSRNIERLHDCACNLTVHVYDYAGVGLLPEEVDKVVSGNLGLYQVFQLYADEVNQYEYIIVLLDDVEILNIDLDFMIDKYNQYNMDIMSPTVSNDSAWAHKVMKTYDRMMIREVNFIELFCYIMKPAVFHEWTSIMTHENTFGWGIDTNMKLLLNVDLYLFDAFKIKHHYINTVDSRLPLHQVCVAQMREYNRLMSKKRNLKLQDFPDYTVLRELDYNQ